MMKVSDALPLQSCALISTLVSTILEFLFLLTFHRFGLNHIPSGPTPLIFNLLYQYSRRVPSVYQFRIFGVIVTNKIFLYILAFQVRSYHYFLGAILTLKT